MKELTRQIAKLIRERARNSAESAVRYESWAVGERTRGTLLNRLADAIEAGKITDPTILDHAYKTGNGDKCAEAEASYVRALLDAQCGCRS